MNNLKTESTEKDLEHIIKKIFFFAGVYGIIILFPQLFMEQKLGFDYPPAITHPEFFYGFNGLALVFQIVFIIISKDPIRYRTIMTTAILEKASFGITVIFLYFTGRLASTVFFFGMIDIFLMCLFIFSYLKTPTQN